MAVMIPIIICLFLQACMVDPDDTIPPNVAITHPVDGATVNGTVNVTCVATDNERVDQVELWVDGVATGLSDNIEPYSMSWATEAYENESQHVLTVRAADDFRNVSDSSPITVTVSNLSNTDPVVAILAPSDGASFRLGSPIQFRAVATDTEDGVLSDTSLVWSSDLDGNFGLDTCFTDSTLSAGSHTITVTVTDSDEAQTSDQISIQVLEPENTPPEVTILSPFDGSTFQPGSNITFSATATDAEDGILAGPSIVWRSDHDGQIGTDTSFTISTLSVNSHTITVTATDSDGAQDSKQINIQVISPSNTPPTVSITSPSDGSSFDEGTAIEFAAAAYDSEDGVLTGSSIVWSSDHDGSFGTGASFSYASLSANTHCITAIVSDSEEAQGSDTIQIEVLEYSNNNPEVDILSPSDGSTYESGTPIQFTAFATDVEDGQLDRYSFVWSSDIDGAFALDSSFVYSELSIGSHTIAVTVTDSDEAQASDQISIQILEPDNTPPEVTILSPSEGSQFQSGSSIEFSATASDEEDGILTGSSIVWDSDKDGQIGTGSSLTSSNLSENSHTITATATDSEGAIASAQVNIQVIALNNTAPTVSILTPAAGSSFEEGATIEFTASASDAEDGVLDGSSVEWNSNLDGLIGTGSSFSNSTLSTGNHSITVTVTDGEGAQASAQVNIQIIVTSNTPPEINITSPLDASTYVGGSTIEFSASASDAEDGSLSGNAIVWTSNLDGVIGTDTSFTSSILSTGNHNILVTATDSEGAQASDTISIQITDP